MNETTHVVIYGVDKAIAAATWCKNTLKSQWVMNLSTTIFADGSYEFFFQDQSDATLFALKWR